MSICVKLSSETQNYFNVIRNKGCTSQKVVKIEYTIGSVIARFQKYVTAFQIQEELASP